MTEEIWRPIKGYEGLYDVSSYGRVRSVDRYKSNNGGIQWIKERILSPEKDKCGYLQVFLHCNGKQHQRKIHRLVAQTFISNPDNLPCVNHKDEDKTNNRVDNLEWCDAKYNCNYGTRNIRIRETKMKNGYWTGLSEKEYKKKYYQENKEKIRDYKHQYYLKRKAGL